MDLVWHRSDLRTSDNTALAYGSEIVPVYIFDPAIIKHGHARRMEWILKNVQSLREEYRSMNSDLLIRVGKATHVLPDVANRENCDRVLWNKSYSPLSRSRDSAVRDVLEENDIEHESFHDKPLEPPESIFTNDGDPYSVFTYYHKKWVDRDKTDPYESVTEDDLVSVSDGRDIPSLDELGFDDVGLEYPKSGTSAARDRLTEFATHHSESYGDNRDIPSKDGTSRLSPYLSYGIIGIREVWEAAQKMNSEDFREQLAWRDFYTQVLYHNPHVVNENYKEYENEIEWNSSEEYLQRWKDGTTGYPIVDAGMRQLQEEGWMHNRVRMIVASFLTKDLLIDWQEGYEWFKEMLIDHDTANNNGGWQWAASTGTDAQPYFRIFNPMTQGEKYDPEAEYIKKYVPELEDVTPEDIHSWNELSAEDRDEKASAYYHPIVDHSEAREEAIEMFEEARGEDD